MLIVILALSFGDVSIARGEDVCPSCLKEEASASGAALLQMGRSRPSLESVVSDGSPNTLVHAKEQHSHALLSLAGYSEKGYLGSPSCLPAATEKERRTAFLALKRGASLLAIESGQEPIGATAMLDAAGFKKTTATCCPVEMEIFFKRLLNSLGLDVCSWPHIQGLMHWFNCVPDMDFQYVLDVIANGNPCKYWGPTGEVCPALSAQCEGHHCGAPITAPLTTTTVAATTLTTTTVTTTTTTVTTTLTAATTATTTTTVAVTTTTTKTTTEATKTTTTTTTTATTTTTTTTTTATTTTTTTTTDDDCDSSSHVPLVFWQAIGGRNGLSQSNLNGLGPDSGPEEFRISKLGQHNGQFFDLVITSPNYEAPAPFMFAGNMINIVEDNGVYGYFGNIFMKKESTMDMTFMIVETGTNTPMVLPKFFFSFFDIDAGASTDPTGREQVVVWGADKYYLADDTELAVSTVDGGTALTATVQGNYLDNPEYPFGLTDLQKRRTVTFKFTSTSQFLARYNVFPGGFTRGRDIFFAGKTALINDKCNDRGVVPPSENPFNPPVPPTKPPHNAEVTA